MTRLFAAILVFGLTVFAVVGEPVAQAESAPEPEISRPAGVPGIDHVIWIWFENREYSAITPASAPYFASLAATYVNYTGFHGITHPSQPNYLHAFAGSNLGVTTNNYCTFPVPEDSLPQQLSAAGKSWRVYAQNYPGGCSDVVTFTGPVDGWGAAGNYDRKHNPAIAFEGTRLNPAECANIQPLANFDPLVNFAFVVPNNINSMHDGSRAQGDAFLQAFAPQVFNSPDWAHTLFIISFDEGTTNINGGGQIYTVAAAPWLTHSDPTTFYNHHSALRTIEEIFGLPYLNGAATSTTMTEVFPPSPTPTATETFTPTDTPTYTPTVTPTNTPTDVIVSLPSIIATPGIVVIPVTVGDLTGRGIVSYDFQVTFDPSVVEPASPAVDIAGTLSNGMTISPHTENPGHFIMGAFQNPGVLIGSGTLINLRFNVIGTLGESTNLTFEDYTDPVSNFHWRFQFNENYPPAVTINGSVTIPAATPTDTPTHTPTNTPTDTPTDTPTNTPTPPAVITGTVTYGNAIGAPSQRFVSNVVIDGVGSPNVSATTDFPGGSYSLTGFGSGAYTVTPSKTASHSTAISSFDAAKIAQYVASLTTFSPAQQTVADASGNSTISSFDAALVAGYAVGGDGGAAGSWRFSPLSRTYPSITTDITGEDYSALLMGEVSGNWQNTGARAANCGSPTVREGDRFNVECTALTDVRASATDEIRVTLTHSVNWTGKEIVVPVVVDGAAEKGIISYEFDLRYDPTVIQPTLDTVDVAGTVSRGLSVVVNSAEPGLLRVAGYGAMPIEENGVLLNLRFTSVGTSGAISPLTWERIIFNDGEPAVMTTDGAVELAGDGK